MASWEVVLSQSLPLTSEYEDAPTQKIISLFDLFRNLFDLVHFCRSFVSCGRLETNKGSVRFTNHKRRAKNKAREPNVMTSVSRAFCSSGRFAGGEVCFKGRPRKLCCKRELGTVLSMRYERCVAGLCADDGFTHKNCIIYRKTSQWGKCWEQTRNGQFDGWREGECVCWCRFPLPLVRRLLDVTCWYHKWWGCHPQSKAHLSDFRRTHSFTRLAMVIWPSRRKMETTIERSEVGICQGMGRSEEDKRCPCEG